MVRQAHVLKGTPTLAPAEESTRNQNNMHRRTRIKEMDGHGIQMQVVSWVSPGQLVPPDQALPLTQAANNRLAGSIAANPTRRSGFAALPWQEPRAAAAELDRSVSELGLKGALILGRPGETFLDDPRYAPVLQKLSDLQVPLYVHPFSPVPQVHEAYYSGFSPLVSAEFSLGAWGWHNEAGSIPGHCRTGTRCITGSPRGTGCGWPDGGCRPC